MRHDSKLQDTSRTSVNEGWEVRYLTRARQQLRENIARTTITIAPDWLPTPENVNALPEPLRRYIHDLQTNADPADTVHDVARSRDSNDPSLR